ncbi:hypothetical protein WMY93_001095 [Mugilogobius chulae]|uniref:L1 transposable element RRM domain-containing protein n=1 Tax=Mugilogobius chulae TaxID=88201 RepID=A0AAW0Q3T3_9GOBI
MDDMKKSMEGRLDTIEAHLSTLQNDHGQAQQRLDGLEEALSHTDVRITALETTCAELQVANGQLKAKINDLEGRSRRQNIRIVGIREGEEKANPTDFVARLIPELLGPANFSKPVKIDRAHRSLKPKPRDSEPPRTIIIKVHNDRDVPKILRLSRQQAPLHYQGRKVFIFPDYTADVSSQRQAFSNVRKKLIDAGAKCSLRFPAKLQVVYNSEVKMFTSPTDAERFATSLAEQV